MEEKTAKMDWMKPTVQPMNLSVHVIQICFPAAMANALTGNMFAVYSVIFCDDDSKSAYRFYVR